MAKGQKRRWTTEEIAQASQAVQAYIREHPDTPRAIAAKALKLPMPIKSIWQYDLRIAKRDTVGGSPRPLAERLRIAREINEYRKAHPKMLIVDVLKEMGLTDSVKPAAYWTWRKRLELADAQRAANRAHHDNDGEEHAAQHFPLAAIPERVVRPAAKVNQRARSDDDAAIALSLLEVATRLLRRNGR